MQACRANPAMLLGAKGDRCKISCLGSVLTALLPCLNSLLRLLAHGAVAQLIPELLCKPQGPL